MEPAADRLPALVEQLLSDHILERLRGAQGVLALLKPYGAARPEAACARALAHGSPHFRTVKTIPRLVLNPPPSRRPSSRPSRR
jgi:hypothetical protein